MHAPAVSSRHDFVIATRPRLPLNLLRSDCRERPKGRTRETAGTHPSCIWRLWGWRNSSPFRNVEERFMHNAHARANYSTL
jgi:hypothetical protein